jgi:restriction endonuclease S subunit
MSKDLNGLIVDDKYDLQEIDTMLFKRSKFLQSGDVLLTTRGDIKSAVFRGKRKVLPHASLVVIRLTEKSVIPEFLALYFTSPAMQKYLERISVGEILQALRLPDIRNIDIPQVSIEQQQQAVAMFQNIQAQKTSYQEIVQNLDKIWETNITTLTQ